MEIKEDRGQYFAVKLLSSIFFCLLLSTSNYPAKAQEAFCLDQTIRQAQDSTIMAFQSRHEYNYYRSITMSFRLCASVDLLYHPGSHFGCGRPAQCRSLFGGRSRRDTVPHCRYRAFEGLLRYTRKRTTAIRERHRGHGGPGFLYRRPPLCPHHCRQSRGGKEWCGTFGSHAHAAPSSHTRHVGYHYIGENRQLNIVICKNLLAFANPL